MAERSHPAVFSIPVTRGFADALVDGLLEQKNKDPLALARGMILVPNNRAGIAIRDGFVRRASQGILLPRIVAIGDPDLGERSGAAIDGIDDEPIPPAVDPLQRQLMLARTIQHDAMNAAEAMRLASELARTLDQLLVEKVDTARLREVEMAQELSRHWAVSLDQLKAILDYWPHELARIGRIDLVDRRNRLLARVADRWRNSPPQHFVVAAGISTTAPAVAGLMHVVARLKQGQVVLAGLDRVMNDEDWAAIAGDDENLGMETHPQFHIRTLLDRMGVTRAEVQEWPGSAKDSATKRRSDAISHAFAPPLSTRNWVSLAPSTRTLRDVYAIELATPAEEAQAIAICIREAIETPEKTVALVTPDRDLARRVSAHLLRWNIQADDSAGQSLISTPHGSLILAMVSAAAEKFAPAPLLGLLKHPLSGSSGNRQLWLDGARKLDLALRGPRPAQGLGGVSLFLKHGDDRTSVVRNEAQLWWADVEPMLRPLERVGYISLEESIVVLRDIATQIAGEAIWAGQAGRALADFVEALIANAVFGPKLVDRASLPHFLRQVMESITIRPGYGGHPRVFIWGLLEAKLQSADLMILAGLNEGVWPQLPAPDPWLAPGIRRRLGLPGLERRIGLSAHDLASAMGAPQVVLSRAARDARSPTIASRFWLRIEALTGGLPPPQTRHDILSREIDGYIGQPERARRPKPNPPTKDRPRSISVTDVDRLSADPYAFYAKSMLRLNALDALDADPGPAWRGSLIHRVLQDWAEHDNYTGGKLVRRIEAALSDGTVHPLTRALWLPRLRDAGRWIEKTVADHQGTGRHPIMAEKSGKIEFAGITIRGRADRIDRLPEGGFAIVDYKTGLPPSNRQITAGFAMQLGLIGLIAERGGFDEGDGNKNNRAALAFEYWSLARDKKGDQFGSLISPVVGRTQVCEPQDFVKTIAAQFEIAAAKWLTGDAPFTAKVQPEYAWSDYDHLMRFEEWEGRDDEII